MNDLANPTEPPHGPPHSVAVVGGGLAGLTAAYYLKAARPDWHVTAFERHTRVGGKVRTSSRGGFTFDWGPNGFLTNVEDTLRLVWDLGLGDELQPASDAAKLRYLYRDGALRELPSSPQAFLRTSLLSSGAKVKAALEFVTGKAADTEETVFEFIQRHFGGEVAETFAEAAVLGITAGDAKELSVDALFPRFRALEQKHGSLLKAMMRSRGKAGRLTSFREGGAQRLVDALKLELERDTALGVGVVGIAPLEPGFELALSTGVSTQEDEVILATPAFVSGELIEGFLPGAAAQLKDIEYADVAVFGVGFNRIDVPLELDGFGFLVPRGEGVRALGVLWSSVVFDDQAPEGQVMLRVICGGTLDPGFMELSDAEAMQSVRDDLRLTMGIAAEPTFFDGVKWPGGIPQYALGHTKRVSSIMMSLQKYPGLYVCGNAYNGIGINDTVRDARRAVAQITGAPPEDAGLEPGETKVIIGNDAYNSPVPSQPVPGQEPNWDAEEIVNK